MQRIILHSDLNNFYASVECFRNPSLRNQPVAVCGNTALRHGIVLAKNERAKAFGVQTGDVIWQAKQKCPRLVCIQPHYETYLHYSSLTKQIYQRYTDRVESFGLDECWLDVTQSQTLFGQGQDIADRLRRQIFFELGVTASVGVSFNKVFAKLASDMKKPNATTVITQNNFKEKIWPLPIQSMIYIGNATQKKLNRFGIFTLGELAQSPLAFLTQILGKNGRTLYAWANGMDTSPVCHHSHHSSIKTIGNSITPPRDLYTPNDIRLVLYPLCESVASRLRAHELACKTVQITIKNQSFLTLQRQSPLENAANTAKQLFHAAYTLIQTTHSSHSLPIRSLGVRACDLIPSRFLQTSLLFPAYREEQAERSIDSLRRRFGHFCLQRASMLTDPALCAVNPKDDHVIYPKSFFHP